MQLSFPLGPIDVCVVMVVLEALRFAATDYASSPEGSARRGNDRPLPLLGATVGINHHPIIGTPHLMGPRSIGEQRRIVAFAALAMQDWQPCLRVGVEATGSDEFELPLLRLASVLGIHIQDFRDAWRFRMRVGPDPPRPTEPSCQGIADAREALGAQVDGQSTVVCSRLQLLQRVHTQPLMYALRRPLANPGHGGDQFHGVTLPPQSVQDRQVPRFDELANAARQVIANAWQIHQRRGAARGNHFRHWPGQPAHRLCSVPVGPNPIRVRTLILEGFGRFLEASGDIIVFPNVNHVANVTSIASLEHTGIHVSPLRLLRNVALLHGLITRKRSALAITGTELRLMAAAAVIGESSIPKSRYRAPAAIGMPIQQFTVS